MSEDAKNTARHEVISAIKLAIEEWEKNLLAITGETYMGEYDPSADSPIAFRKLVIQEMKKILEVINEKL